MCNTSKGTTMSVTESLAISSVVAPSRIRCPSTIQLELGCSGSASGHKSFMLKCSPWCVNYIFRYFRYFRYFR